MKLRCFLFFAVMLLAFQSCKKENTHPSNTILQSTGWLLDSPYFKGSYLLNSVKVNDSILVVTNSVTMSQVNVNHLNEPSSIQYFNSNSVYDQALQPTLTSGIAITLLDSHHIKVFSILPPLSDDGFYSYQPDYSSETVTVKAYPVVYPNAPGYPVINSTYMLTPDEVDYQHNKMYVSLLKLSGTTNGTKHTSIGLSSKKSLVLTPADLTPGFADGNYFSATYYGKFFFGYASQFFRIDTLGNVKPFGYSPVLNVNNGRVKQMFRLNDNLFTVGPDEWFVSTDEGETWSLFANFFGSLYPSLLYLNVGDDVYAVSNGLIWHVTLSGNTLHFQELDYTGLNSDNVITSISEVGKYTFITTLSGLYYRETSTFNTPGK